MPKFVINEAVQREGWEQKPLSGLPWEAHERLPEYEITPLRSMDSLAAELGIGQLLVKDEAKRLSLPAFKILGASWAVVRLLERELGPVSQPWASIEELRQRIATLPPRPLVTATDGNHGRGVARIARWIGWPAVIFMPRGANPAKVEAIRGEGAELHLLDGSHDEAVQRAFEEAESRGGWLIQDTSWPGYEEIPGWIVEGYATLMHEVEQQLDQRGEEWPDLVFAPFGTGALAGAMLEHLRKPEGPHPAILTVEPMPAACAYESLRAGRSVTVDLPDETVMVGLNCNSVASILMEPLLRGVDAGLVIEDEWALKALVAYRSHGVASGESGAASLGGLMALMTSPELTEVRDHLGLSEKSRVLILNTEGLGNG